MKQRLVLSLASLLFACFTIQAQVTVGSGLPPTRATLLDLKAKQANGTVTSISDDDNLTAGLGDGGLLLPRVKLVSISTLEPFIPANDPEFVNNTNSLKEKLAGLMVYNVTNNGVGSTLYPAVYTWNGAVWVTSQANEAVSSIAGQPQAFTFYETGEETVDPLVFTVDGLGDWTYQWYQVTGNNVHVRIGTPIGQSGTIYTNATSANSAGANTASFRPQAAIKGTTRDADYTGFYRFYCIAESSLGAKLTSDIAEVAVGCGAKNNAGEWISFMCFNLGAQNGITIAEQKNYTVPTYSNSPSNGLHIYSDFPDQENVYGDLFQWGRIADGHEDRQSAIVARGSMATTDIGTGSRCTTTDTGRPYLQVKKGTAWYGNFVTSTDAVNYNWNAHTTQTNLDQLWRIGRFAQNDPCAHYKADGTYQEFWHEGIDTQNNGDAACTDSGTAWRAPSQDEWGALYKGGTLTGSAANATANTWVWTGGASSQNINSIRGYEVKPDGVTTTLFLPASGNRSNISGSLYLTGSNGYYWSTNVIATNAYTLSFNNSTVNTAGNYYRAYGYAIRCLKNT